MATSPGQHPTAEEPPDLLRRSTPGSPEYERSSRLARARQYMLSSGYRASPSGQSNVVRATNMASTSLALVGCSVVLGAQQLSVAARVAAEQDDPAPTIESV